jgi:hypothetical protein
MLSDSKHLRQLETGLASLATIIAQLMAQLAEHDEHMTPI